MLFEQFDGCYGWLQFKMNSDLDWQRIIEWSHSQATYLLRVVVSPEQLELELQDKFTGDIWHSAYSNLAIEELTERAKNRKKYSVFVNMLRAALQGTKENLFIEILSYRQITIKTMKNGKVSTTIPPEQASKRFLILNYNMDFQKIQLPISIQYFDEASPERLRLTIKRLSQEMNNYRVSRSQSELERQNACLKYEIQSLKARQKSSGKLEESVLVQSKIGEIQKQLNEKISYIEKLNLKIAELEKGKEEASEKIVQGEQKIQALEQQLKERQNSTNRSANEKDYAEKIDFLIKKMEKIGEQLLFAHQKQRKSEIKIATLERQLQSMQKSQQRTSNRFKEDRDNQSPLSRSGQKQLSVRSGHSNKSGKSNTSKKNISNLLKNSKVKNNTNLNYKNYSNKKSSVYDSDTESSRMRRMNNARNSPFRQGAANANTKKSTKHQERSRSKSREKVTSPRQSKIVESQMYSEAFQSDDSEERFQRLNRQIGKTVKQKPQAAKKTTSRVSTTSNQVNTLEKKLQTLEELIQQAAKAKKN